MGVVLCHLQSIYNRTDDGKKKRSLPTTVILCNYIINSRNLEVLKTTSKMDKTRYYTTIDITITKIEIILQCTSTRIILVYIIYKRRHYVRL